MKYFLTFLLAAGFILLMACKSRPAPSTVNTPVDPAIMDKMWKSIDSLESKGLYASALEEIRTIKKLALADGDSGHLIKAVTFENRYLTQLEEDASIKALIRAEEEMESFPEPARSVMHSLTAQWYTIYLQSHLWELRGRTEFAGPAGPDIRTWGIRHFLDRIYQHYSQSVTWEGLKSADVKAYLLLLTEEQGTDELRPTLYDILMHRAVDYLSGTESYLTKPVYDFVLTDPKAFAPATTFAGITFPVTDSFSSTWQALHWYQQLIAFRLQDDTHAAALLDADLKRLRFVYDNILLDAKDSLYQAALEHLSTKYSSNPESSLVDYYIAQHLIQQAAQWENNPASPHRLAYNKAIEICKKAIERFPDAYGSKMCRTLIQQMEQKSVSAAVESINLPGEELLAKLEYRNISSVHLKIVRLPQSPRRWRGDAWDGDEILRRLNQLPAEKTWAQTFDDGGDHQPHTTEFGLPSLPLGHYALLVSDSENFESNKATSGTIMFTVSSLGYWYIDDREQSQVAAIVDRKSGMPLQGVKVEFMSLEYNQGRRQQEEVKLGEGISDASGWVTVPAHENKNIALRLTKGEDELYLDESYYTYRYGTQGSSSPSTLFFTDRAIYRPGQKFYFKGYALEFDKQGIPAAVPNRKLEVVLYDANGQEVQKQSFQTNEYGTFFGHFDLPAGGLTGQMSVSSSYGASRHYFQVEEYKRPRFEVTFDTIKETFRLNEKVLLAARATDYAGSAVAGASVGYRVERVSVRPWWYGYWKGIWPGRDDRQVLATGQAFTKQDGTVDIAFEAKAKPGGDPDLMYRFEVTVYVTDITGESHEASKSIVLNQQGYQVNIDLPESISMKQLNKISVTSTNTDGAGVKISGDVEVSAIKGSTRNQRSRLWNSPDILTLAASDYTTRFSNYAQPGLDNMSAWPVDRVLGKMALTVDNAGVADLSSLITKPGYYKVDWTWKDKNGHELKMTQYVMAYEHGQLLPGFEVSRVDFDNHPYEPGASPTFDLMSGIVDGPKTIRVVERRTQPSLNIWIDVNASAGLPVKLTESDRGGVYVHHLTAFNNRFFREQHMIQVPWTNKELTVALKTWRDKMEPGDDETWTITVEGQKHEKVTAEMLLSMYDASLDAFVPHQWLMNLYPTTAAKTLIQNTQPVAQSYWGLTYHWDTNYQDVPVRQYRDLNVYGYYPEGGYYPMVRGGRRYKGEREELMMQANEAMPAPSAVLDGVAVAKDQDISSEKKQATAPTEKNTPPPLRSVLDETVFFYPQVRTDAQGNLTFSFKMKEGLTRWKFQALAHTKDLAYGLTSAEVVTQKQLMVFPNPPRFFRDGDTISFQMKATNLTEMALSGKAGLKIIDAISEEDVSGAWGLSAGEKAIQIDKKGTTPVSWTLNIPKGWNRPVKYQVLATAGAYTDGEESILPVVTNRILVTETLPLPIKANETKTFVFKSMMDNRTATSVDHQYVVEMTTSPAWYAVQALPYLMEYPHECAEQVFSRMYANSLASHIATANPSIKKVYDAWRLTNDDALLSNLEKNKDLKSAMLEETPWVRDAMGETQQKKDIALLFESNRLSNESKQAMDILRQMQMSSGGFPWFPGGRDNWYITQYIVEGFGHLRKMGVNVPAGNGMDIIQKAIPYIDSRMIEWYDELKKEEAKGRLKMEDHQVGSMQAHYLYARSFYPEIEHPAKIDEVLNYLHVQFAKYWLQHGIYEQGLIALGTYRTWPDDKLSRDILASLRERSIVQEELGRYWKINPGYQWNEAGVEMQSLMVELYQDMEVPQAEIDELRVWLLKQKQTTRWKSTRATASAVYALLIHPDAWLQSVGVVQVKVGNQEVIGNSTPAEAGTGYVKKTWSGDKIRNDWSSITVSNPNPHIAWGSAYWQYWEDIDKVKPSGVDNPLKISRALLIVRKTDRGEVTEPASYKSLKVGDKLIVRLIVETDREMDFVHLKDLRASGFEPMDVLSGYKWSGGLGYYQSTKDLATHFFIDHLPRGKFVIEYPVTVAQAGAYSEGLATLQSMYAPEFGGHSSGARVTVKPN